MQKLHNNHFILNYSMYFPAFENTEVFLGSLRVYGFQMKTLKRLHIILHNKNMKKKNSIKSSERKKHFHTASVSLKWTFNTVRG